MLVSHRSTVLTSATTSTISHCSGRFYCISGFCHAMLCISAACAVVQCRSVHLGSVTDTVCPRPPLTLTVDRLTLKLICELHLRWGTFLPNLGTLSLWVLESFAVHATDGRRDGQKQRLLSPSPVSLFLYYAAASKCIFRIFHCRVATSFYTVVHEKTLINFDQFLKFCHW